ncbi:hypothetical protein NP493_42g00028 [Ridgeia piscesae]|uniref:Uncharacterized protein n=1 Tax=Ridgeia piscesae TaxID=27915 RepID=A0AAD9PC60_RIDPI|nr:hypothetical protein NP493_42g00028 [Ridgeia piscesae]
MISSHLSRVLIARCRNRRSLAPPRRPLLTVIGRRRERDRSIGAGATNERRRARPGGRAHFVRRTVRIRRPTNNGHAAVCMAPPRQLTLIVLIIRQRRAIDICVETDICEKCLCLRRRRRVGEASPS